MDRDNHINGTKYLTDNRTIKTKKAIHLKILLTITISIAISIIILSIILYIYFEKVILTKIYESESNNLFQAGISTKLMQDLSKSIAIQMFNDLALSGLLFIPHEEPIDIYNALISFNKYRNLIPYIHSIYIFNPENNAFYISSPARSGMIQARETFFDREIIDLLEQPENINSTCPIPRIIEEPEIVQDHTREYGVYTFIYNLSGVKRYDYPGTIIINISEDWVRDIIDSLDINPDNKALIIDKEDRLLISDSKRKMLSSANIYKYFKDTLFENNKSGYTITEINNDNVFLVYSVINSFDWIFIKMIPYDKIMMEINDVRKNLIIIALSLLFVGAVLSFLTARRLYKPIDNLFKELAILEEERNSDSLILKQYNLRRLLTQSKVLSDYELNKFINEVNINLVKNDCFVLLLLEIDHYKEFCDNYTNKEQHLLKLGMIDTTSNILKEKYRNEGLEVRSNRLLFILNTKDEEPDVLQAFMIPLIKKTQNKIKKTFGLSVSATISKPHGNMNEISHIFETVLNLSNNKYLSGYNSIIYENNPDFNKKKTFKYQYKDEEELISAINNGHKQKAITVYKEIMEYALPFGYNAIITTRNSIAYALNKFINKLKKYGLPNFSFDFLSFFSEINCLETLIETDNRFFHLIQRLSGAIEKRNKSTNFALISKIINRIENDYKNTNLGISSLADEYRLSAAYLGRLFNKYTGKPMTDYINEVRITRAGEYIINTNYSILEIMKMTGFTNKTHFYNIFKKYNGITPKHYRQKAVDISV